MTNVQNNPCFYRLEGEMLTFGNGLFSHRVSGVSAVSASQEDFNGLSAPYTKITAQRGEETAVFCLWQDLPVVFVPDCREKELFTLQGEHWTIRCIKLSAFTDDFDTLTTEKEVHLFARAIRNVEGDIFYFENQQTGEAAILVSETPDYITAKLTVRGGVVSVENEENSVAFGFCKAGECEALCRNYYRHAVLRKELVTMSNTWGDRNGFSRVCNDFVLKEIDAGAQIGIDVVQIDDGWQLGSTQDKALRDEKGRRFFPDVFWELADSKFPNGMKSVADYAAKSNIRVGLWFAPDSHNNFGTLERDKAVLKKAYDQWNMRFFKLDMFWVTNREEQKRFLELLDFIYRLGDDVAVQLDVTRNLRMNYLCGKEYGNVFVENRYTKSANSFPHRILRNLWMIGKHIPTSKFQFEVINPDLNRECYAEDDSFAPGLYDMDYLFASVMLSNPLFWMEMQFLPDERKAQLKKIMPVWKEYREKLAKADVMPIGEKPSGRSFTGFRVQTNDGEVYLLLFREVTDRETAVMQVPVAAGKAEVLASNGDVDVTVENGCVRATFGKPRCYAFVKVL